MLKLANGAALIGVVLTAHDFRAHLAEMAEPWTSPPFQSDVAAFRPIISSIEAIPMALGRFRERDVASGPVVREPVVRDALADLGEIVSMTAGPERHDATLSFRFRDGTHRAIGVGDALVVRPHAEWGRLEPVPVRYLFLGIEPEPDRPGWRALFDVETDGVTIERVFLPARRAAPAPSVTVPDDGDGMRAVGRRDRILIVRSDRVSEPGRFARPAAPRLFDRRPDGRLAVTPEGRRYLKDRGRELLRDVETRSAGGLRIIRIRPESPAGRFGLRPGDTVLAINGRAVRGRADAVRIAKEEAGRPATRVIRVQILRLGREIVQEFDIRDR